MAVKRIDNLSAESEIRKSKMLLFAQTSPSNLPVPAQRLFLALLSSIDPNQEGNTFIIKGKDIASLSNLPANVVGQQLQEMSVSADTLRKYTLVIKEDDGNILRVGLISSTKYLRGERAIRVSVDQYLMPYLKKMREQYVISYAAGGPMKFRSEYSICLFDMMNYYLKEGYHYFTLEETRRMFNIPDGKIKYVSTLNQKVIKPALRDINTYTNLRVSVKHEKIKCKIVGYHFFVESSVPHVEVSLEEDTTDSLISTLISEPIKFNKYSLSKLIDQYGIESIKNNYEYTKKMNPSNFASYLYWAITNQVYERTREIEQIKKINENYKPESMPKFRDEIALFEEPEPEASSIDLDRIKESNPELYQIYTRIMNIKNQNNNAAAE